MKWQLGSLAVSRTVWNNRLSICRGCEWWQELGKTKIARCRRCNCSSAKLVLKESKCPLFPPKWGKEK